MLTALLPALLTAAATSSAAPLVAFHGNVAIVDDVYREVLGLTPKAAATPETARLVQARLNEFLHRAGYDLARVVVRVRPGHLDAEIDEGRLDKIVIFGEGALETLELHLGISMPFHVFNRPELERQLRRLSRKYPLEGISYEIVPAERHAEGPIRPEDLLARTFRVQLIPPGEPFELHIRVRPEAWTTGVSPEVAVDGLDGLMVGAAYRGAALLFDGDRWQARGRAGGIVRQTLDKSTSRPVFTRASAEGRWYTPPVLGEAFRVYAQLAGDTFHRQRADLSLESFDYALVETGLNAALDPMAGLTLALGAGVDHLALLGLESAGVPMPIVLDTPRSETRAFGRLSARLVLNPSEIHQDRLHALDLEGRLYGRLGRVPGREVRLLMTYARAFEFGWDELQLRARGMLLADDVLFPEEDPAGAESLHGPFGQTIYARKDASVSAELRVSIVRDLFKVGVFHDLVGFGAINRSTGAESPQLADAFGLGLHALLLDSFQLDVYFGVGFRGGGGAGTFDDGIALALRQAF